MRNLIRNEPTIFDGNDHSLKIRFEETRADSLPGPPQAEPDHIWTIIIGLRE